MARPVKRKNVCERPEVSLFKPAGIPLSAREAVILTLDEYEAVRLADREGMYQEDAARCMDTSRQTFARILDSAHRKIADALVESRPLVIEGGNVKLCGRPGCRRKPGCPKEKEGKELLESSDPGADEVER